MDSTVGQLDIVLTADAQKANAEIDKFNAKIDAMVAKAKASGNAMAGANAGAIDSLKNMGETVKETAGKIDDLGAKTDELTGKQHTAWLAIGAVVGSTTDGMIKKVLAFIDSASAIPGAIDAGMKGIIQPMWLANDQLRLANDNTENLIAVLEKKPVNNAALALDEVRVEADRAAMAADALNTKMEAVLSKNHISAWHRLTGVAGTANVEGTINAGDQEIADLTNQRQIALHDGDQATADSLDKQIRAKLDYYEQHLKEMLSEAKDGKYKNNAANRSDLLGGIAAFGAEKDDIAQGDRKRADDAQLKADQEAQRAQEEAAKERAEQLKRMEATLVDRQLQGLIPTSGPAAEKAIYAYWNGYTNAFDRGTDQFKAIADKKLAQVKLMSDRFERAFAMMKAGDSVGGMNLLTGAKTPVPDDGAEALAKGQQGMAKMGADLSHAQDISQDSANEMKAHEARTQAQLMEIQLSKEAGRSITQLDALRQEAALHAQAFDEELARLALKRADAEKASYDDAVKRAEALARIDAQMAQLQGQKALQGQRDSIALNPGGSSLGVGFVDALDELADATRQKAAEMRAFTLTAVNSVNSQLEREMQGKSKAGDWRKLGGDIFGNASGAALKQFEGYGLKALGFGGGGKKDGSSAANALYVQIAGGGGMSAMPQSDLNKLLYPGGAPSMPNVTGPAADIVSGKPSFFTSAMHAFGIPGFADGGDAPPNSLIMTSERGPELMRTGPGGAHITSHEDITDALSNRGGGGPVYHIDARGTDAALVEARIRHASAMARSAGAADAVRATQEHYLRIPR